MTTSALDVLGALLEALRSELLALRTWDDDSVHGPRDPPSSAHARSAPWHSQRKLGCLQFWRSFLQLQGETDRAMYSLMSVQGALLRQGAGGCVWSS